MVRILSCLAAVFVLAAGAVHAAQPARLEEIMRRGTLRVGHDRRLLAFHLFRQGDVGFDVDMSAGQERWARLAGEAALNRNSSFRDSYDESDEDHVCRMAEP
jgi:hypothetical protein